MILYLNKGKVHERYSLFLLFIHPLQISIEYLAVVYTQRCTACGLVPGTRRAQRVVCLFEVSAGSRENRVELGNPIVKPSRVASSQRARNIKSSVLFTIRKRFIDFIDDADEWL